MTTWPSCPDALAARGWRLADKATADDQGLWFATGADAAVDYPEDSHELLAAVEDQSEWFGERNRLIAAALGRDGLPARMVEVGSGNGFVAAHLRALGVDALAVEPGGGGARASNARGVPTVCGLFEQLEFPAGSLECVGVFDVIEHLERPGELLAEAHRVLVPGGRIAVSVPALPSLWSETDVLAGHYRRYRFKTLDTELRAAGFKPLTRAYAFASLVPPIGLLRALPHRLGRKSDSGELSETATRQVAGYGGLGRRVSRAAFAAERRLRLPFGSSIIGVFAKS